MNVFTYTDRVSARCLAFVAILSLIMSAFPAAFSFAQEFPQEEQLPPAPTEEIVVEEVVDIPVSDLPEEVTASDTVPTTTEPTEEVQESVAEEESVPMARMAIAEVVIDDNGEDRPQKCIEENMLVNGSFEEPVVSGQWNIFSTVFGWLSSAGELEIWKNFNGNGADTAAAGNQNAELDGNTPTTISQTLTVVPGDTYQISFAFSPRAGRNLADNAVEVIWDGVSQGTVSADGTGNTGNVWTNHYFTVVAEDNSALVELEDISSATSYGTLIDDVSVCLVERAEVEKELVTIVVTENTTNTENTNGWMFNRDVTTATPFEFNTDEAVIGDGSLNVLPIGANPADKFIAEYFVLDEIDNVLSFSYDFKIGASGEDTDEEQFYMNVYANYGESSPTKFYDCRYNVVPTVGSVAGFTTVTFDPTLDYPVTTRGGATPSPYTCPSSPADMNLQSPGSTFRAFALNLGDTSASDLGLDGYFDNVVLDTPTKMTTFDFEPKKMSEGNVISGCKFNDANANGLKDDGEVNLPGWEIVLTQGESEPQYDITDENGCYSFEVGYGSYQVSETQQEGWEQTATIGDGVDGDVCYINFYSEVASRDERVAMDIPMYNDSATCDFGNHQVEVNECTYSDNLLENGSFETPLVDPESDGWDIFDSVVDGLEWVVAWINPASGAPAVPKLELHDGRPASDGNQYAELDSNYTQPGDPQIPGDARVKISQTVPTVIGEEYTLTFDFSAIPGRRGGPGNNKVEVIVDGTVIDTHTADGRLETSTKWTTYTHKFIATRDSTEVAFADAGRANTFGTFIDNVSLAGCVLEEEIEEEGDSSSVSGGGNGKRVELEDEPDRRVEGDSDTREDESDETNGPGRVLGEQTSVMPLGAPNTGQGGTSPVSISLPTMIAILGNSARKNK